jgi:hypothetical protein
LTGQPFEQRVRAVVAQAQSQQAADDTVAHRTNTAYQNA